MIMRMVITPTITLFKINKTMVSIEKIKDLEMVWFESAIVQIRMH